MGAYAKTIAIFEALPPEKRVLIGGSLSLLDEDGPCWCAVGLVVPRLPEEAWAPTHAFIRAREQCPAVAERLRELGLTVEAAAALERQNDSILGNRPDIRQRRFDYILSWMRNHEATGTYPAAQETE